MQREQVKTAYEKCRTKLPNRPPDEIDFGLGWRAAFQNMENWARGRRCTGEDVMEYTLKELSGD